MALLGQFGYDNELDYCELRFTALKTIVQVSRWLETTINFLETQVPHW